MTDWVGSLHVWVFGMKMDLGRRIFFSVVFLGLTGVVSGSHAEPAPKDASDPLGYYENLGAGFFIRTCDLYGLEEEPGRKTMIARHYWFAAFVFWHEVENERIPSSDMVLTAIWKLGKSHFSDEDFALNRDPLMWPKDSENPAFRSSCFPNISRADYDRLREEFRDWISNCLRDHER